MKRDTIAAALVASLTLSACATAYNPEMGFDGGSEVSMITPTRAVVSFTGNGYTSGDKVQQYVMLRAAELTHESGYTHFAILNGEDASTTTTIGGFSGYGYGNGLYGTSYASTIVFPKERLEVQMLTGNPEPGNPAIFSAAEVINTIRPTLAK